MDEAERAHWHAIDRGEAEPSWSLLRKPLLRSRTLTSAGQQAASWALDQIAALLGDEWLKRSFRERSCPMMHPQWTPLNDVPLTHLRRLQLACQIALLRRVPGWWDFQKDARAQTERWNSMLMQFEVGGLALRHGREVELEPLLGSGRKADLLVNGPDGMLVEMTSMELPADMLEASRFTGRVFPELLAVGENHHVTVAGNIGEVAARAVLEAWLAGVDTAAAQIAGTGRQRRISSPGGGEITLTAIPPAEREGVERISGPVTTRDEWTRVESRVERKAKQSVAELPVWIRIDAPVSLWGLSAPTRWPRPEMHAALAANIAATIAPLSHVAGVVLSGQPTSGPPGGSAGSWELLDGQALGLICHLGQELYREVVVVTGSHAAGRGHLAEWRTWYENESSWLDWTLGQLGHPRATELLRAGAR